MPTGLAASDNEVKQCRDFSESIFREWLPADAVRDGVIHDWAMTKAQRGGSFPSVCYPVRGAMGMEQI